MRYQDFDNLTDMRTMNMQTCKDADKNIKTKRQNETMKKIKYLIKSATVILMKYLMKYNKISHRKPRYCNQIIQINQINMQNFVLFHCPKIAMIASFSFSFLFLFILLNFHIVLCPII